MAPPLDAPFAGPPQMIWLIRLATRLSKIVVVSGINHSRPNNLKRRSPGSFPKPSLCSSGLNQLMKTNARKMTMNQRIMLLV